MGLGFGKLSLGLGMASLEGFQFLVVLRGEQDLKLLIHQILSNIIIDARGIL